MKKLFWICLLCLFVGCGDVDPTVRPVAETAVSPTSPPLPTITATPLPPLISTPTLAATAAPTQPPTVTATPTATPIPFPVYQGEPLNRELIGIQIHLRDEDQDWLFEQLDMLGVGWVKVQVSWKLYEPQQGNFHPERFAELDQFIARANASGLSVMLGVSKAPEWSRPTTELDGPPSEFALFQTFTAYLAQRYTGQVAAYELWNEPNLNREWNGRSLGGSDLVDLIRFGAAGIRAFDETAVLISAAPATTGINDGINAIDDRVYLRQMLESDVGDIVDGIGVHPYGAANPPDSTMANPAPFIQGYNNHPSFFFSDTMTDYDTLLAEFGVAKPLWITEFGWGSFENIADTPPAGAEFMQQVSEWQQAEYIARAYELNQQRSNAAPIILWNLNFGPLLGTEFSESGYSILAPDGSPRPAYLTLEDAIGK